MQRDMNLVREILLSLEGQSTGFAKHPVKIDGYEVETIGFHIYLLGEAGLLETEDITTYAAKSPQAMPISITWAGYDFLETSRNQSLWRKATKTVTDKGLPLIIDILKPLLIQLAKQELGI